MTESAFQTKFIRELKRTFPGCEVLKNDANYRQGIPDWTFLWGPFWAMLEIKGSRKASTQPNQEYYVTKMNDMSFAAFVYPENAEEVLAALQGAFASRGSALVSQS